MKSINSINTCLYFSNIAGNKRHINVSNEQLNLALIEGIKIDGSNILGLTEICDSEFILWPDLNSKHIEISEGSKICTSYNCKVTTTEGTDINDISDELIKNTLEKANSFGLINLNSKSILNFMFPQCAPIILLNNS
jgi:glutamine synthetase